MRQISAYLPYWPIFAGALLFAVYAAVLFFCSRKALVNHAGSLQWVREYGRPGFDFSGEKLTNKKPDWLCGFGVAVFALIVSAVYALVKSRYHTGSWMTDFFTLYTLCIVCISIVGALAVWLLSAHLTGSNLLSVCCALLFAAVCINKHNTMCILAVSLLLLYFWFATDDEKPLFPRELLYYAACIVLVACTVSAAALFWLVPLYILLHLLKSLRRFCGKRGRLALCIGLAVVMWLLCVFVLIAANGFVLYGRTFFPYLGSIMTSAEFYKKLLQLFKAIPASMIVMPRRNLFICVLMDAPVVCISIAGFVTALLRVRARHDSRALIALSVGLAFAVIWVVSGSYLLSLPAVLLFGFLGLSFTGSGKKASVVIFTAVSCAYYIGLYALGYLMPLHFEILHRLT